MPLSSYISIQIQDRCSLPVLLIGAREDAPLTDQVLSSTEQGPVTSTHKFPHIEVLETLDGFCWKVVPARGWRRTPIGDAETKKFWGGEEVTRVFQSSRYDLELQDYSLIPNMDYYPQDDYYYDYASSDIEQVFRRPYRWMIGLKEFVGYSGMNYLTQKGLCLPINPDGPQPAVNGEDPAKGTKQCKVSVTPRFPNFTFPS